LRASIGAEVGVYMSAAVSRNMTVGLRHGADRIRGALKLLRPTVRAINALNAERLANDAD